MTKYQKMASNGMRKIIINGLWLMFSESKRLSVYFILLSRWSNPNGFLVDTSQGTQSIYLNSHLQHYQWNYQALLFVSKNQKISSLNVDKCVADKMLQYQFIWLQMKLTVGNACVFENFLQVYESCAKVTCLAHGHT